jgi:hypothetical protein
MAFAIENVRPFTLDDDADATAAPQGLMIRERMKMMLCIELLDLLGLNTIGHVEASSENEKIRTGARPRSEKAGRRQCGV